MARLTRVSADFAAGFQAAYGMVRHIEEQQSMPFKSMLGACTLSPTKALEAWGRTLVVDDEEAARVESLN